MKGSFPGVFVRCCRLICFGVLSMLVTLGACAHVPPSIQPPCDGDHYMSRAGQLKDIYAADQKDREDFLHWTPTESFDVIRRDRDRRTKVAEIFAEGCFKSPDDYLYAATVFQHGEVPDHFFQAYVWAMKAFNLGKQEAGIMAGNAVDRYLMNLGYKQFFGGQAVSEEPKAGFDQVCFCLWPVEESFPDGERERLHFKTHDQLLAWVKEMNAGRPGCSSSVCKKEAKSVPHGLVPGLW